eukprot:1157579-Pelagomonas_calceolata.AAC.4
MLHGRVEDLGEGVDESDERGRRELVWVAKERVGQKREGGQNWPIWVWGWVAGCAHSPMRTGTAPTMASRLVRRWLAFPSMHPKSKVAFNAS